MYFYSSYLNENMIDEDYLLDEAINTNTESLSSKNASATCIKTFRALTYEMEKVTDVLIRLLEQDNKTISKDLSRLKGFKSYIDDLKKYSMEELDINKFQYSIKNTYKKLGQALKDFDRTVIYIAKKTNNVDKLNKVSSRLTTLTIDSFTAVNDYFDTVRKDGEATKNQLANKGNISNKSKAVQESRLYSLSEDEGFVAGASGMLSSLYNLVTNPLESLGTEVGKIGKAISNLKNKWGSGLSGNASSIDKFSALIQTNEFGTILGGVVVAGGIIYLLKKAIQKIRKWIRGNTY